MPAPSFRQSSLKGASLIPAIGASTTWLGSLCLPMVIGVLAVMAGGFSKDSGLRERAGDDTTAVTGVKENLVGF